MGHGARTTVLTDKYSSDSLDTGENAGDVDGVPSCRWGYVSLVSTLSRSTRSVSDEGRGSYPSPASGVLPTSSQLCLLLLSS